jgi:hypothetical protein
VTDLPALIVTVHVVPVDESHPIQPVKRSPRAGAAVRVTTVPLSKLADSLEQLPPQAIPPGLEVTVPPPMRPPLVRVSEFCRTKVGVTVVGAVMVTAHAPVPEQFPPLHPANLEPLAGEAVRVTTVP